MLLFTPKKTFHSRARRRTTDGFTLVELLMVIAVILILAGITFGITRGVQTAQARAKAQAELAVIAQALEQFKAVNGDYPWTDDSEGDSADLLLVKSLMGFKKFDRTGNNATFRDKTGAEIPANGPKAFINPTKLNWSGTLPDNPTEIPAGVSFLDPWGTPYVYLYKETTTWDNFDYVLYSAGPNGVDNPVAANGVLDSTFLDHEDNTDNIFVGQ